MRPSSGPRSGDAGPGAPAASPPAADPGADPIADPAEDHAADPGAEPVADPGGRGPEPDRVLVIAPQPFFEERGTPIAVRHLLGALRDLGRGADVVTYPVGRPVDIPGIELHRVPNPFGFRRVPIGFSLRKLVLDVFVLFAVRSRLRSRRYAYVHAVEEAGLIAALLLRRGGPFLVYDMNSSLPEQLRNHRLFGTRPAQALGTRVERWLLRRADLVLCSAGLARRVEALAPGTRRREWTFPARAEPVAPERAAACRAGLDVAAGAPLVAYVGSFEPYQGIPLLVEAACDVARRTPEAVFLLAGAADDRAREAALAAVPAELRPRFRVLRRVPTERVPELLAAADVLVSARAYGGNLPLKVFEYLAAGRPIVATDIPAHRAVLTSETAALVEPTADALAAAIGSLLHDAAERARLAAAARAYAERHLGWDAMLAQIDAVLRLAREAAVDRATAGAAADRPASRARPAP